MHPVEVVDGGDGEGSDAGPVPGDSNCPLVDVGIELDVFAPRVEIDQAADHPLPSPAAQFAVTETTHDAFVGDQPGHDRGLWRLAGSWLSGEGAVTGTANGDLHPRFFPAVEDDTDVVGGDRRVGVLVEGEREGFGGVCCPAAHVGVRLVLQFA